MFAELRSYTISPGQTEGLLAQFHETSLPLFKAHNMTAYGPWLRALTKGHELVYVLEFDDENDRDTKWEAFRSDPRWQAAQDAVKDQTPFVASIKTIAMTR